MKLWKPSKMKVKALQFTKKSLISRKWVFFHGRRPISRKIFWLWNRELRLSLQLFWKVLGGYLFLKHPVHVSMLLWIEVTNIAYCVILVDITLLWMGRVFWPICSGQPQSTLLCFNTTGTTVLSTVVPVFLKQSLSNEGHTIPVRW